MSDRFRDRSNEKGGSPEDARHGVITMEAVANAASLSNIHIAPFEPLAKWSDVEVQLDAGKMAIEPFAVPMTITPAIAAKMLERNAENRTLSKVKVLSYADDMANDRFIGMNGQTIVFSREGLLNDGQTRLHAIIKADVELRTLVVFGASRSARMTQDIGKARTVSDFLKMYGVNADTTLISSVANICLGHYRGTLRGKEVGISKALYRSSVQPKKQTPAAERIEFALKNAKEFADCIKAVPQTNIGGRAKLSACYFIINRANRSAPDAVKTFFERLVNGDNLTAGDPILYVRNRLIEGGGRVSAYAVIMLVVKAWNAHVRGERDVEFRAKGAIPEIAVA